MLKQPADSGIQVLLIFYCNLAADPVEEVEQVCYMDDLYHYI